jgi:hypothetical protein
LVSLLRPEVKTLELELSRFHWDRADRVLMSSLRELLTQFAAEDDTLPTLERIHLLRAADDEDEDLALTTKEQFPRTLHSHILPLKARGIRVFVDDCEICV